MPTATRSVIALAEVGERIEAQHLPATWGDPPRAEAAPAPERAAVEGLADMTRHAIDRALDDCAGDVAATARRLGVHRSTVYRHKSRRR